MASHENTWNFLLGCLLLFASFALFAISWGALSNLFAEYQDSPSGTYVAIGALFLALAFGSGACGVALVRQSIRRG